MHTIVVTVSYKAYNVMEREKSVQCFQTLNCKPQTQTHCCKSNEIFSTEQEESYMQLFSQIGKYKHM